MENKNTVTLRLSRSAQIETNKDIALIRLDTMTHVVGQPVLVRYYGDEDSIEAITAIGISNGTGRDCYSIMSTSREIVVNGVLEELPDVSELKNGARYINKVDGDWVLISISNNQARILKPLSDSIENIYLDLETGFRWFYSNGRLKREDNFLEEDEIHNIFRDEFLKIHKPVVSSKFVSGNFFIKGMILQDLKFEIYVINHDKEDITEKCNIKIQSDLFGEERLKSIQGHIYTIYGEVDKDITYTITATLDDLEITDKIYLRFGNYTYFGSVDKKDHTNINTLTKKSWDGTSDLELAFDLDKQYSLIYIPKEFDNIVEILDDNYLNYINDYTTSNVIISGVAYIRYIKNDKVTINNFKQIFKL